MQPNLTQFGENARKNQHVSFKGQAAVEAALILVFLMLLLVGVADVARLYGSHLQVVQAAGVGARWATLTDNQRDCTGYPDVQAATLDSLSGFVPAPVVVVLPTPAVDPRYVRVQITYQHNFLFGIINNVPLSFTGGATMPGNYGTGVGTCDATAIVPPGITSIVLPSFTPRPPPPTNTPPPPTNTPIPTNTPTPTPTCVPHGLQGADACLIGNDPGLRYWRAEVTVFGFRAGDSVRVSLCDPTCGPDRTMTLDPNILGRFTFDSGPPGNNKARAGDMLRFTLFPSDPCSTSLPDYSIPAVTCSP